MRVSRTLATVVVSAFALAVAAAGCGSSSSSSSSSSGSSSSSNNNNNTANGGGASSGKKIVMILPIPCAAGPYFASICNAANAQAKQIPGVSFQIKTTPTPDINLYNNLLQTIATSDRPNGLIVMPPSATAVLPELEQISATGTKVAFIDSNVPGLKSAQSFIATNNVDAGKAAARWLIQNASKAKSRDVGLILNDPGITSTDDRKAGFIAGLKGSGFTVVAQAASPNPCDTNFARNNVQNFLTAHPNIGAIFNVCDPYALGTAQALQAANRLNVLNIGIDGVPANVKLIVDKKGYSADVAQYPNKIGADGVNVIVSALEGKPVPKVIDTGTSTVTPANAASYLSTNGYS